MTRLMNKLSAICRITPAQLAVCLIATFLIGCGVTLFLACELGSDALTVFIDGVNRSFHIPVPAVNQAVAAVVFLFAFLLNRRDIGASTMINVLTIGLFISLSERIFPPEVIREMPPAVRVMIMISAQCMMAAGYALMQTLSSGMGYSDAFLWGLCRRLGIGYPVLKTIYEAFFMVSGFLLGGITGPGTIFSIATLGICISAFRRMMSR